MHLPSSTSPAHIAVSFGILKRIFQHPAKRITLRSYP